ncbi:uncharacterized protein V6R79_019088 [Siganus canaliculatus]
MVSKVVCEEQIKCPDVTCHWKYSRNCGSRDERQKVNGKSSAFSSTCQCTKSQREKHTLESQTEKEGGGGGGEKKNLTTGSENSGAEKCNQLCVEQKAGKAAMSPVITGCVSEVSGLLCVYTLLFSVSKATSSPPATASLLGLLGLLGLGLRCREEAPARVIALWGIAPTLFACLFTCLPHSAGLSLRLFVSPRCRGVVGLVVSCLSCCKGFKLTLVWGSRQRQVHTFVIISVNILSL